MTWPFLRATRWSDEESARYYACGAWNRRGLDAMLGEHARDTPDKLAFHDGTASLTFAELDARARGLATGLRARGVGLGAVVAVRMGNTVDHAMVVYGLAAAGAVLFELPPDATPTQVAAALRRTRAVAFLSDATTLAPDAFEGNRAFQRAYVGQAIERVATQAEPGATGPSPRRWPRGRRG